MRVHGVDADGLARQVKAVADRLLQPAPVVKTPSRTERVAAARIGVGAPTRCPDLGEGDVITEQLSSDGQRAGHQDDFAGPASFTGVERRHDRPGGGRQGEPLRPHMFGSGPMNW